MDSVRNRSLSNTQDLEVQIETPRRPSLGQRFMNGISSIFSSRRPSETEGLRAEGVGRFAATASVRADSTVVNSLFARASYQEEASYAMPNHQYAALRGEEPYATSWNRTYETSHTQAAREEAIYEEPEASYQEVTYSQGAIYETIGEGVYENSNNLIYTDVAALNQLVYIDATLNHSNEWNDLDYNIFERADFTTSSPSLETTDSGANGSMEEESHQESLPVSFKEFGQHSVGTTVALRDASDSD
jgi:hypothetical protein